MDCFAELSKKTGYKIGNQQIVSSYDWLWAPVSCGPCEAVGALPVYDMSEHALPVRFAEAAFYEYPVGAVRSFGKVLRIFPNGGWIRVTAFNLEKPATGNVKLPRPGSAAPDLLRT